MTDCAVGLVRGLVHAALVALGITAFGVGSASAALITFTSVLSPEVPGATGSGSVTLEFDTTAQTLFIDTTFTGLSGVTSVAHIHCCTADPFVGTIGVAVTPGTLPGFPTGLTTGSYSQLLDLTLTSTYTNAFRGTDSPAQASARLLQGLADGHAYFNIHTSTFPGGEIRGFPQEPASPQPVPEPATLLLVGSGMAAGAWSRRRRTRS